jgi:sulfonate transport system substrate-binding protein
MLQSAGVLSLAAALPSIGNAQSNLRGVTLRAATYKGGHKTLLEAAGLAQTPYQIDWKEFNSGVQHIESINADALDFGSGSEIPAVFAAKAKASVKVVAVYHEDLNNQATLAQKTRPFTRWQICVASAWVMCAAPPRICICINSSRKLG